MISEFLGKILPNSGMSELAPFAELDFENV